MEKRSYLKPEINNIKIQTDYLAADCATDLFSSTSKGKDYLGFTVKSGVTTIYLVEWTGTKNSDGTYDLTGHNHYTRSVTPGKKYKFTGTFVDNWTGTIVNAPDNPKPTEAGGWDECQNPPYNCEYNYIGSLEIVEVE